MIEEIPMSDDSSTAPDTPEADGPCVMQILPSLVTGGVERGASDISGALVAAGWKSVVVSAGGPMVHEVERAGGIHVTLPVDTKNPLRIRKNVDVIAEAIREHGADLVHARSRAPAWSAKDAAQKVGVPFVTTFHGTYNFESAIKKKYNSIMAEGDLVIAISDFIADHIIENYGTDPDRIRVIHRGVDLDIFDPAAVSAERMIQFSQDWRLEDGAPVLMLPGRITRWKGQSVFVEAIARLKRDDLRCLLVGDDQGRTRYRQELEDHISRVGIGSFFQFAGHCRDMPAAYMLADVVVSASTDPEAFGRVAAEAQALGRPVIATDHGAARETVVDGETGFLVPPGDPDALAEAILDVLAMSPDEREDLARRAINHVRSNFSKEAMSADTLNVYREALGLDAQPDLQDG